MNAAEQRVRLRLAKVEHLEKLIADIDRDVTKVPRLGWAAVLCVPVGVFTRSFAWAFVEVVLVGCLVTVVYYILGVRRDEYAVECEQIRRELAANGQLPAGS